MTEDKGEFLPGIFPSGGGRKKKNAKTRPLFFSYSRLSLYEECPQKYKFRYIDKIPEKPKPYFAFGHSIHAALEFLYKVKAPPFPSLEEMLEFYEKDWNSASWIEKGYESEEKHGEDFVKGREMLQAYYKKHMKDFRVPFLVEYSTDVEVDGLKVRIIADKIDYLGGGRIMITDYKTGRDVKRSPDQLHMYQKICELDPALPRKIRDIYGDDVDSVKAEKMLFYHVPSLKEYEFARADEKEIEKFWERALSAADDIRAGRFDPRPGEFQCRFCDFRQYCPIFAGEKYVPESEDVSGELKADLEKLIELSDRKRETEKEIARIKDRIIGVFREKGIKSLDSLGRKVRLSKTEKWSFSDRNAVIRALKENNLYERTVKPMLKEIVNIINDENIPKSIRDKITVHGEKRTVYDLDIEDTL